MSQKRKSYSPAEKVRLLKEHLVNGVPVSKICEENQLQPTVFYRWQRQFFENGAAAFQNARDRETARLKKKIASLEEKVAKKNEVLGELMEEHLRLKKILGKPDPAQGQEEDASIRCRFHPKMAGQNAALPSWNAGGTGDPAQQISRLGRTLRHRKPPQCPGSEAIPASKKTSGKPSCATTSGIRTRATAACLI